VRGGMLSGQQSEGKGGSTLACSSSSSLLSSCCRGSGGGVIEVLYKFIQKQAGFSASSFPLLPLLLPRSPTHPPTQPQTQRTGPKTSHATTETQASPLSQRRQCERRHAGGQTWRA